MSYTYLFYGGEKRFYSLRRIYLLGGLFLGFCLFFLLRSCGNNSFERIYTIGQDTQWYKLDLMGKERNFAAFSNDLMIRIARQRGFTTRIIPIPKDELIPYLEEGRVQGILTTLEPSYLNMHRLIFSEPYFLTGPVLIIPLTAPLQGWNEKAQKIVGINIDSTAMLQLEQDPSIQVKTYDDILLALSDLSERRIDGAIFPAIPAYIYVSVFYKDQLKIATLPLTNEGVRLVALKNREGEELINQFNEGLNELKQNGTYFILTEKWGLVNIENLFR